MSNLHCSVNNAFPRLVKDGSTPTSPCIYWWQKDFLGWAVIFVSTVMLSKPSLLIFISIVYHNL